MPEPIRNVGAALVIGLCLAAGAASAQTPLEGILPLLVDTPLTQDIDGGATLTFSVAANSGDFVHVRVDQRNTDVELALAAPTGETVARRNRPDTKSDPEGLSFIAAGEGRHLVTVRSLEPSGRRGRIGIVVQAHATGSRDRVHVDAERLTEEGHRLYAPASMAEARQRYEAALPLWRTAGAPEGEALTHLSIASSFHAQDNAIAAEPLITQALRLVEPIGALPLQAAALNMLTTGFLMQGKARQALESGSRALELARAGASLNAEHGALSNLGSAHWMLGNRAEELRFGDLSLETARQLDDRAQLAMTLQNLGVSRLTAGDFQAALTISREALAIHRESGDQRRQSVALNTIGEIYRESGQLREALGYHGEALAIRRRLLLPDLVAQSLNNLSLAQKDLRDFQSARRSIDEAVELRRAVGNRNGEATALLNLGVLLYAELGDTNGGLRHLQQALAIVQTLGLASTEASVLMHLGRLSVLGGADADARVHYLRAGELARTVSSKSNQIDSLRELAAIDLRAGDLRGARARLDAAVAVLDDVMDGVLGDELRAGYFATNARVYEQYVDVLMHLHREHPDAGHDLEALGMAEQGRARGLLRLLSEAKVDLRRDVAPELLARLPDLQRRVDALAAPSSSRAGPGAAADGTASRDLNAALTELQELRAQIRASSTKFAALVNPVPLQARDIQATVVEPGTVLLEYALGTDRSYLWVITSERITAVTLPARTEIEPLARRLHTLLGARNEVPAGELPAARRQRLRRAEAQLAADTAQLSRLLLAPAEAEIQRARRVVVAADGALAFIPFGVLPFSRGGAPLVASHDVTGVPSASAIALMRGARAGRRRPAKTLAVLADPVFDRDDPRLGRPPASRGRPSAGPPAGSPAEPDLAPAWTRAAAALTGARLGRLPHTREEANALLALVQPDRRISAIGVQASRSALESAAMGDVRILHLATHGFVNGDYPDLSGIALSMVDERGDLTDGFFRLNHVYNLRLNADLVVLSACQTALGEQVRGEGLIGLTRGLMYAGAARVVASLWKVDDQATAALMAAFYGAMLGPRQLSAASALREAQNALRINPRWQSPYYWAAFTLQGEWRPE